MRPNQNRVDNNNYKNNNNNRNQNTNDNKSTIVCATAFEIQIVFMVNLWNRKPYWRQWSIAELFEKAIPGNIKRVFVEDAVNHLFASTCRALETDEPASRWILCPIANIRVTDCGRYLLEHRKYPVITGNRL